MCDAVKNLNLNLKYSYLLIARKKILNEKYENIKQILYKDFEKIK